MHLSYRQEAVNDGADVTPLRSVLQARAAVTVKDRSPRVVHVLWTSNVRGSHGGTKPSPRFDAGYRAEGHKPSNPVLSS
jgi:hypothetical protein